MRKFRHFTLIFLVLFSWGVKLKAQADSTSSTRMRYDDRTYRPYIKTVQLHQVGWKFSPPIIQLNSDQRLELDFDDLEADIKSYYYTIIHCDADWQPSDINTFDYLTGFNQDFLNNYSTSNTIMQHYTHYTLMLPNKNMQMIISGNYLLKVYKDNNPDSVVLTRRFMVYEKKVFIKAWEKPGIGEELFTKQEIQFNINTAQYPITDPFQAFKVFILQNGRWDNCISGVQPQFVNGGELQYTQDMGNTFDGGNQFRNLDMTSVKMLSQHMHRFVPNSDYPEIELNEDKSYAKLAYIFQNDIDGQFLILNKDDDTASSNTNGEYAIVHFYLDEDTAFTTGNVYIFGALSDWRCKKEFMMHYVDSLKRYEATLYLKQGYYDFQYAFRADHSNIADVTPIEGNHSETENTYTIYTYYRPIGIYYDQLIGVTTFHAPSN